MDDVSLKALKQRRSVVVAIMLAFLLLLGINPGSGVDTAENSQPANVLSSSAEGSELAINALDSLEVKGRAPKTGYARSEFGDGWASVQGCDMRNIILLRSMSEVVVSSDGCVVLNGTLADPYTGDVIEFKRGAGTSGDVQIDHVVALSDGWQKGAQNISEQERLLFANDPLNLLAVDGSANQKKGDSDAASWLPPNKGFRCRYVARQIAVKSKYSLWVTSAEKAVMIRVLNGCGEQVLPVEL